MGPVDDTDSHEVSRILRAADAGGSADLKALLPLVYDHLRAMAGRHMAGERRDHTLEPTALVHEAYLRLVGREPLAWTSKAHFYAAAAEAMRRILVEHARARKREKRGGAWQRVPVDVADLAAHHDPEKILALDDAIRRLEEVDARNAAVVRLRFYSGLTAAETAQALGLSERTVKREWCYAKAWLVRALGGDE